MDSLVAMPTSRSEQLVVQELSREVLVYDLERHKAHCLNETAAYIWRRCDGTTKIDDVARGLESQFGLPADARIVTLALTDLRKARLLETSDRHAKTDGGRREALKRIGLAAGLAAIVPVVTSIVAPTAAMAATSCRSLNQTCSPTQLCCSGLICNGSPNGTCVAL